ncbi:unnamed protein product [Ostreobium quekettii]|uniref:Hexosyltransferase n=1 Tax=Ostreobium quekettii TaxID=121088 RepID=A0A8S1J307_9CHLO|nr:unnamed protein product [Ostreobium quekettii]|eukprot:evm.model.scf_778.6 EVM.evm.TU.scf_778.6   scf_778:44318-51591(+)
MLRAGRPSIAANTGDPPAEDAVTMGASEDNLHGGGLPPLDGCSGTTGLGGRALYDGKTTTRRMPAFPNGRERRRLHAHNILSIVFFLMGCLMMVMSNYRSADKRVVCGQAVVRSDAHTSSDLLQVQKVFGGAKLSAQHQVEFVVAGHYVHLRDALKVDLPIAPDEIAYHKKASSGDSSMDATNASMLLPIREPDDLNESGDITDNEVRMFIGITSDCCSDLAVEKRNAIRESWKQKIESEHPGVDIKFVLSQPGHDRYDKVLKSLEEELAHHDDMIFVRGLDTYGNLKFKVFGLFKYASSSPRQYTHVLKTDDDCYVRMPLLLEAIKGGDGKVITENLYTGCQESSIGFKFIRDPKSKWFMSYEEFPDHVEKQLDGLKYLAGWGYVMSRDVMLYVVWKWLSFRAHPEEAPPWFSRFQWEDVIMGYLVQQKGVKMKENDAFKAAWRSCTNNTAVRHLDIDAPSLVKGLYEQEVSQVWAKKTVQCSSLAFKPGDYDDWRAVRNKVLPAGTHV